MRNKNVWKNKLIRQEKLPSRQKPSGNLKEKGILYVR